MNFSIFQKSVDFYLLCRDVWAVLLFSWFLYFIPYLNNPPAALIIGATFALSLFKLQNYLWREGEIGGIFSLPGLNLDNKKIWRYYFVDNRKTEWLIFIPKEEKDKSMIGKRINRMPLLSLAKSIEITDWSDKMDQTDKETVKKYSSIGHTSDKCAVWHIGFTVKRIEYIITLIIAVTFMAGQFLFFESLGR